MSGVVPMQPRGQATVWLKNENTPYCSAHGSVGWMPKALIGPQTTEFCTQTIVDIAPSPAFVPRRVVRKVADSLW